MIVLRLLAIYLAAAAGSLWLARRFVRPIGIAPALFLVLAPFLLTGRAMLTAGVYAPLDIAYDVPPLLAERALRGIGPPRPAVLGDVVHQEIPWRKAVREAVKNGRLPLWNRFVLAGEPLLATQQPAVLHPATWLGFLLPLGQAWTFEMALRFFLALACAYLYLRELECGEIASLFGASAWAFCDYLAFYLGYPLSPATAPLPLLLLGLRRIASVADRRAFGLTVVALFLVITAGHPESLLHVTAAAGIFFLFDLAAAPPGRRLRALGLSAASGVLSLGLTAAVLLPFREAVPETAEFMIRRAWFAGAERSLPWRESLERSVSNLLPFTAGVREPSAYAGSVLLPLALAGLWLRRRERWPLIVSGVLGLSAFGKVPVVNDAICRLPLFDIGLNERLVFLPAFALAVLAAFGVERLRRGSGRGTALAGVAAAAAVWIALSAQWKVDAGMAAAGLGSSLLLGLVPLGLLAAGLLAPQSLRRAVTPAGLALFLLLGQRFAELRRIYPSVPSEAFYPALPLLEPVPRGAPHRIAAVGFTFIPNVAAMYELEDVRGYEAMTFAPLVETFPLWCVPQPVWFNRVDDPARPFLSFLGVRYVLAPLRTPIPSGWRVLAEDGSVRLLENPTALPRAFVPRWIVQESDPVRQRERLLAIRDFASDGVVAGPAAAPERNGEATVEIASYTPQRIALDIDARQKALVATSMTRWPGWRLEVDGREEPLRSYNRAFLAFEVAPGRHQAELVYRPRSWIAGLWISGLSLLAAVALLARRPARPAAISESRRPTCAAPGPPPTGP